MRKPITFLRDSDVAQRDGQSRTTRWRQVRCGLYPPPVRVANRAKRYIEHEIDARNQALAAGATDDELRALIAELVAARNCAA